MCVCVCVAFQVLGLRFKVEGFDFRPWRKGLGCSLQGIRGFQDSGTLGFKEYWVLAKGVPIENYGGGILKHSHMAYGSVLGVCFRTWGSVLQLYDSDLPVFCDRTRDSGFRCCENHVKNYLDLTTAP